MRFFLFLTVLLSMNVVCKAQQDPTFTKYQFNSLIYNPGVTGSNDHLIATALHRNQWFNVNGGPTTQIVSVHSPLENDNIGLGFSAFNDRIGPTKQISVQLSYAYRLKLGKGRLGIGMSASMLNWRADWSELLAQDMVDPTYPNTSINTWLPNFGAGVHYQHPVYFIGVGIPHILENTLEGRGVTSSAVARQYRHYIFNGGMSFRINNNLQFKPYFTLKTTGLFGEDRENGVKVGAPTTLDIDLSFLFHKTLQVGVAYRSALESVSSNSSYDSVDFWFMYKIPKNSIKIGGAYDYALTPLGQAGGGAYQVMVGYELYKEVRKATPLRPY